jgi:hypothetical protein
MLHGKMVNSMLLIIFLGMTTKLSSLQVKTLMLQRGMTIKQRKLLYLPRNP